MEEEIQHLTIKQWAEDDRPREKLMLKGKQALSDAELLAILLATGTKNESAVQLSQRILLAYQNNLNELAKLSVVDLKKFKGIGEAKAITIVAALELGRRRKDVGVNEREHIKTSLDAYNHFRSKLGDLPHEEFWITLLNRSNKIIKTELVGRGGVSGTVADVRLIVKSAVENLASSVIVAHNHPSGNLRPSDSDIKLTKKIREATRFFDIQLVDHLIVGDASYFSFADEGML
ncbi:MAG TPA: DNA repair protein RadC [Bacteroidia bacterium]|jgi:DNA repair protein RadC|nr:DNA repair protein RadC [Bacteroidia bacterium]